MLVIKFHLIPLPVYVETFLSSDIWLTQLKSCSTYKGLPHLNMSSEQCKHPLVELDKNKKIHSVGHYLPCLPVCIEFLNVGQKCTELLI